MPLRTSSLSQGCGGLSAAGGGGPASRRRTTGPPEALTKDAYASVLDEQIAARVVEPNEDVMPVPFGIDRFGVAGERKMGQRLGGQMAPIRKDAYALMLNEQISERNARCAAEVRIDEEKPEHFDEYAGKGRRLAPAVPSKASYAVDLQAQIEAQAARRREGAVPNSPDACMFPEEAAPEKGRRHVCQVAIDTHAYALSLKEQMADRDARRALERQRSPDMAQGDQAPLERRGRRRAQTPVSKESYMHELKGQIAEREAHRAADAFHTKASERGAPALDAPKIARGGRRGGYPEALSPESYALSLQQQIAARDAERAALRPDGACSHSQAFIGNEEATSVHTRQRRHAKEMPPLSKSSYAMELQEQMAEHDARRAADAFHRQKPQDDEGWGLAGKVAPAHGKRHIGPAAPISQASYAGSLREQIAERDGHRTARMARGYAALGVSAGGLPGDGAGAEAADPWSGAALAPVAARDDPRRADESDADALERLLNDHAAAASR